MSVTFHLYRIRDDVDFLGNLEDKVKWNIKNDENLVKIEKEHGYRDDLTVEELSEFNRKTKAKSFSDGNIHEIFDKTYIKAIFKGKRGLSRLLKRLEKLNFKTFCNKNGYTYKYIVLDEVLYRQGWFLKKRFFKKEITWCICTTKEQMISFFNQYINYTGSDTRGREAVEAFTNAWETGVIFECDW